MTQTTDLSDIKQYILICCANTKKEDNGFTPLNWSQMMFCEELVEEKYLLKTVFDKYILSANGAVWVENFYNG
jgi:hypothetical protein